MSTRRTIPAHLSATLLALTMAVSLGAAGGAAAVPVTAGLGGSDAPAHQSTLLQRLTAAARCLMGQTEARAHKRLAAHRPALRAQLNQPIPTDHRDPLSPAIPPLESHLLNLPPPAAV